VGLGGGEGDGGEVGGVVWLGDGRVGMVNAGCSV